MIIHDDLEELFLLLNAHHVDYIVVGGYAVAFHGFIRATKDVDIFFANTPKNIQKLMAVLTDFGISPDTMDQSTFSESGNIIRIGSSPMLVEFFNTISGVTFDDAWEKRVAGHYGRAEVSFLSKKHLLAAKLAAGRPQDLIDIKELSSSDE